MRRLRILQVTPSFYPARGYGGGPLAAYEISKRLVKQGHEVTVYTTDANDKWSRLKAGIKNMNGIKTCYFRNISNSVAFSHKLFLSPGMLAVARKEMKGFDIIHLHDLRTFQNIIAHHYARKYGVPYVLHTHAAHLRIIKKQRLKQVFDLLFGTRILREANIVVGLNKAEVEQFKGLGVREDRIKIIPTGTDLSKYNNLPPKGAFRTKYDIANSEKIILFLGRIHQSKGIDLLIKAFAEVVEDLSGVKLVIAGQDDGFLPALKKLVTGLKINDKVLFTGRVAEEDKLAIYVDADVFATPSFYGFPATFLEAWACGTPIVTTPKGGFIEGIDNKVGCVVEFDKDQLRDALLKLLTDEGLRRQFGENARKLVREHYSWDSVVNLIEQNYYDVVSQR